MGSDARMRDAVERQAKCIHERNQMFGEACPSYDKARRQAEARAEKVYRKKLGE